LAKHIKMDRKSKIQLLQNLSAGKISIAELRPKTLKIHVAVGEPYNEPARYFYGNDEIDHEKFLKIRGKFNASSDNKITVHVPD
jgi:hypothetical protein